MLSGMNRYIFIAALVLLLIVAGYVAIVGMTLQIATLLAPLVAVLLAAYLAIRLWARSRPHP
jgi:hypothetical protein